MKGGRPHYNGLTGKYDLPDAKSGTELTRRYNAAEANMLNYLMTHSGFAHYHFPYYASDTNAFYNDLSAVEAVYNELDYDQRERFIAYLQEIVKYRSLDLSDSDLGGHSTQLQVICNVLNSLGAKPKMDKSKLAIVQTKKNRGLYVVPFNIKRASERLEEIKLRREQHEKMFASEKKRLESIEAERREQEKLNRRLIAIYSTEPPKVLDTILLEGEFYRVVEEYDTDKILEVLHEKYGKKGGTKRKHRFKRSRRLRKY